jgi:hypothetical protein
MAISVTPAVSDPTRTPGRYQAAAHSLATRFMPSFKELTSSTSHASIAARACLLWCAARATRRADGEPRLRRQIACSAGARPGGRRPDRPARIRADGRL